jgi:DNA-binding GntR family transcriptional regulator
MKTNSASQPVTKAPAVAAATASDISTSAARSMDHGQRRKVIVEELLTDIVQGRLRSGERLVIQSLAARFGVSQSPIREALVALEGVGVLDVEPNRGAVVRSLTETDVREISQVRRALECTAIRLACGHMDLDVLCELAEAFEAAAGFDLQASVPNGHTAARRKAIDRARGLDSQLHDLIAESCGNRFLIKELARLKILFRGFRDLAWQSPAANRNLQRYSEEAHEHLAIVRALLANDARAASKAMSAHIRSGTKYWSRGLNQHPPATR